MTLDDQNRKIMIEHNIVRAKSTFYDAVLLVEHDRLTAGVNRIYYALFYTISAMALYREYQTKKHSQLIRWFNKEFIKTDILIKHWKERFFIYKNGGESPIGSNRAFWVNVGPSHGGKHHIPTYIDKSGQVQNVTKNVKGGCLMIGGLCFRDTYHSTPVEVP